MANGDLGTLYYSVEARTGKLLDAEKDVDRATERMKKGFDEATGATSKHERALGRLKPITKGVREESQRLGGSLDGIRNAARLAAGALAAIGITTGIRNAIDQIGQFQVAMNGLAAVSGATEDQLVDLEKQARSLGATSQFSAQQAAEAQRFLAMAGFEVNEILGATPGILELATAASIDLGTAADIASNVLGGMRMEVEELNRVNDVLAATASQSNTNIQQLGQALSFAAPFAASAGVELEEVAAAIGVMSDAGIQASRAGTGMVGVIRQLSSVTSTGEKALSRYGLSIADVDITTRGLEPVLDTLRAASISTADAIEIFGSEAGAAAQVLINDYNGAIEGAEGSAARMADQIDRGLVPAMKSLQSAAAESILQLGDSGLAGGLENVIRTVTGVISVWNGMGDAWAEANGVGEDTLAVIERVAQAIQVMAAMAAGRAVQGIGALIVAKSGLTAGTLSLTGALTGLRTVALTLFGPMGLIAGAAATIYTFRDELGLAGQEAQNTAKRINQLTESISTMSATEIARNLEKARMEMRFLSDQGQNLRRVLSDMNPGDNWDGRTYSELQDQLDDIRQEAMNARNSVRELEGALDDATTPTEGFKLELEELDLALNGAGQGAGNAKNAFSENASVISDLEEQLYQTRLEAEELAQRQAELRLNAFATDDQIARVRELGAALYEASEMAKREGMFGDDPASHIRGEVDPLSGGMFDDQLARYQAEEEAEIERYAAQLERLREAKELELEVREGYQSLEEQMAKEHSSRMQQIEAAKSQAIFKSAEQGFGAITDVMRTAFGEQSSLYRAAFAAQKAAAIAQSTVAIYQGIAMAAANPWPINLAAMVSVAAATAGLVSNIAGVSMGSGRQYGGPVAAGGMHRINENGAPEVFNAANGRQYMLANQRGEVVSNRDATKGQGQGPEVRVIVNEAPPGTQVQERAGADGARELIVDIAQGGPASRTLENAYGLQRVGR